MSKIGLFEKLFGGRRAEKHVRSYFKLLNGYLPVFTSYEGGVYEMELTRAAIHARATHISKLTPKLTGENGKKLQSILEHRPNPYMTTSQFLYRTSTILDVCNTAFIVPIEDRAGELTGYYPVYPSRCEVVDVGGEAYLRYTFASGQTAAVEYSRVAVLTKFQFKSDFFGESNEALRPTMELIHAQNQGIIEGVKNSASFRFMAKVNNWSTTEDLAEERKNFTKKNFSGEGAGGILLFPNTYMDIKQVESSPFVINPMQMKLIQESVYNYFGVNEDILQNKTIGDSWSAFYEGAVEPFAVQLSLGMSGMTFTPEELERGDAIIWTANRLQYMTNQDKLNVSVQMFDRALMSRNDIMDIWNMPHVEDGDRYYIRKEYAEVSKIGEEEHSEKTGN